MIKLLQPILCGENLYSHFSIFQSPDNADSLEVYFGLALLEVVSSKNSFHYKYLLARLYNGKFKRKKLIESFGHTSSTLKRWGDAVKSGDIILMQKAFSGQGSKRKFTPEIIHFIRIEFNKIYPTNKYNYSKIIRKEIKDIFQEEFTSEAIRYILNEEKKKMCLSTNNKEIIEETKSPASDYNPINNIDSSTVNLSNACDLDLKLAMKNVNNRKHSIQNSNNPEVVPMHHLGLVIVLQIINHLKFDLKINYQWLCSILLGATNLEQSESLDFTALEYILNQTCIKSARNQHIILNLVATDEHRLSIFNENAKNLNLKDHTYFYYDPHSISYSGIKNILKGWCGSLGKVVKVNYHDFIHTSKGEPVYFEIADNYLDMRDRFINTINYFNNFILGKPAIKPTFIVDRGIYGKDKMIEINNNGYGLVTWDKNYKKDGWNENLEKNIFYIQRTRNNSSDLKTWDICFIRDNKWCKITGFYRLIVRIIPPWKSKEIELPVLTNGSIDDQSAVFAILNRWLQENDFKYMIRHFGLNEITSYKSTSYSSIEGKLVEKKVFSDEHKYFLKLEKQTQNSLKKLLLEKHNWTNGKEVFPKNNEIYELTVLLEEIKNQKKEITKKVDKAEKLIKENKEILVSDKKAYMDALKITARNIFYQRVNEFKIYYDNNRNNHKLLRELIRSSGNIIIKNNKIIYELNPTRRYGKKQFDNISEFLLNISENTNKINHNNIIKVITLKKQNK